jgi:copper transport protein
MALAWVLLTGLPASAHAELVATSPASGQHLDRLPAQITLQFTEQISPVRGAVRLVDAAGQTVSRADAVSVAGHSNQVSLAVPADLPDGTYLVTWRVISADTHPVGGSFAFGVGDLTAGPLRTDGGSAAGILPQPPAQGRDGAVTGAYWVSRGLGYVALALFGGGLLFVLWCWPAGVGDPAARRLIGAGWLAGLVATVADVVLQGLWVADAPLTRLADLGLIGSTLDTAFGQLVATRLALLAVGGLALYLLRGPGFARGVLDRVLPPPPWRTRVTLAVAGLYVTALCATWAGNGHARAGAGAPLALTTDTVHLLAMALWFGGLGLLFGCVLVARHASGVADAGYVLPRFSRLAMVCVAVLIATGTFQAWRELRGTDILSGSNYVRVLAFKIAAFGLLVCLGAAGRSLVARRYGPASSGGRRRAAAERQDRAALSLMRRSVLLEVGIAGCVLGLTAALVSTSPGGSSTSPGPLPGPLSGLDLATPTAASGGPYTAQLALRDSTQVRLRIDPATTGVNRIALTVRDARGVLRDVPEIRLRLSQPGLGIDPMAVSLTRTSLGQFSATGVQLPVSGTWQVDVLVRTTEIDQETVSTKLTLR